MAKVLVLGMKLTSRPAAVTAGLFGLFISTVAFVDFNRDIMISDAVKSEFKLRV